MERKTKSRLLIGGLIVFSALIAIYTYWVFLSSDNPTQDWQAFLLNVSTELIGALIVFFFFNLFFFLDDWDLSERVTGLLKKLEQERPSAETFFHKLPDIEPLLREANAIELCGVSLTSTINRQLSLIRDSLIDGKTVRLLIIDPRSIAVEMANARSEPRDFGYFKKRLDASLSDITYLYEKWQEYTEPGNETSNLFEIRLIPYVPSFGIQIFHKAQAKGKMLVEMYPHHVGHGTPPVFTLDEGDDAYWFHYFKDQFDEIWKKSVAWTPQLLKTEKGPDIKQFSIAKADDFLFENSPDQTPYFQNANEICLYGIDLAGTLSFHLHSLKKCLDKNGSRIRVVITSKDVKSLNQEKSLEMLKTLSTTQSKGTIEVRELHGPAHFSLIATDPTLAKGRLQIRIYLPVWNNQNTAKFELFRERDTYWTNYFQEQFEEIWEASTEILSSAKSSGKNDDGRIDTVTAN